MWEVRLCLEGYCIFLSVSEVSGVFYLRCLSEVSGVSRVFRWCLDGDKWGWKGEKQGGK